LIAALLLVSTTAVVTYARLDERNGFQGSLVDVGEIAIHGVQGLEVEDVFQGDRILSDNEELEWEEDFDFDDEDEEDEDVLYLEDEDEDEDKLYLGDEDEEYGLDMQDIEAMFLGLDEDSNLDTGEGNGRMLTGKSSCPIGYKAKSKECRTRLLRECYVPMHKKNKKGTKKSKGKGNSKKNVGTGSAKGSGKNNLPAQTDSSNNNNKKSGSNRALTKKRRPRVPYKCIIAIRNCCRRRHKCKCKKGHKGCRCTKDPTLPPTPYHDTSPPTSLPTTLEPTVSPTLPPAVFTSPPTTTEPTSEPVLNPDICPQGSVAICECRALTTVCSAP
jgi:hypothetical protein